jgi:hypothetical protein
VLVVVEELHARSRHSAVGSDAKNIRQLPKGAENSKQSVYSKKYDKAMWFEDITKLHHNTELTRSPTQIRQRENVQKSHVKFRNEKST